MRATRTLLSGAGLAVLLMLVFAPQALGAVAGTVTRWVANQLQFQGSSGSDAFQFKTDGLRAHFGTGANDFISSDGTDLTAASKFNASYFGQGLLNGCYYSNAVTHGYCFESGTQSLIFTNNSAEQWRISGATGDFTTTQGRNIKTDGNITPVTDNTGALGTTPLSWSSLSVQGAGDIGILTVGTRIAFESVHGSTSPPTISSGFGGTPSIPSHNGTLTFTVNVGTGGTASAGVLAFPVTAATGWKCDCNDLAGAISVADTRQTASSTTTCTLTNINTTTGVALAWGVSEVLTCDAMAY